MLNTKRARKQTDATRNRHNSRNDDVAGQLNKATFAPMADETPTRYDDFSINHGVEYSARWSKPNISRQHDQIVENPPTHRSKPSILALTEAATSTTT